MSDKNESPTPHDDAENEPNETTASHDHDVETDESADRTLTDEELDSASGGMF